MEKRFPDSLITINYEERRFQNKFKKSSKWSY